MADPEKIFRDALVADSDTVTFFTGGIMFLRAPQQAKPPYAVISLVAEDRDGVLTGPDTLPRALIEVQVVAEDIADVGEGRGLIRERMDALITSTIAICRLESQRTEFGDEANLPRAICDYRLTYKEE